MSKKCFYNVIFDGNVTGGGNVAAIFHDFRWLKNCNLYSVWMDGWIYSGDKTVIRPMEFNLYTTDAYGSNGLFVYKLNSPTKVLLGPKAFYINDVVYADQLNGVGFVRGISYQASFMTVGKQSEYISLVKSELI